MPLLFSDYFDTPERLLMDKLTTNHSTITRPKKNPSVPLEINVKLDVLKIVNVVSISASFATVYKLVIIHIYFLRVCVSFTAFKR